MWRACLVVSAFAVLAGCVTTPPGAEQITKTPAERLLAFQSPTDGDATLIVTRDVGYSGSACRIAVFIDGKEVARLERGERAIFHVPSGQRVLGAWGTGRGLCGYQEGKNRNETDATVKPGQTRQFRAMVVPNLGPTINPSTL